MSEKEVRQKAYAEGYEQGKFDARVEAEVRKDAISREWVMTKLSEWEKGKAFPTIADKSIIRFIANEIKHTAPSVILTSPTWTPCSERLPEGPGEYICTCRWDENEPFRVDVLEYGCPVNEKWKDSERVFPGGYAFGENWGHDGKDEIDNIEEVIAWMPMPEVYKEVNNG